MFSTHVLSINGKDFCYNCEGANELTLEVVRDDENQAKLQFVIMTVLDLSDTHMEFLLTHFTESK